MTSRLTFLLKTIQGRVLFTGTTLGAVALGVTADKLRQKKNKERLTPAEAQFTTSSMHPIPHGWTGGVWSIWNDYPTESPATITTRKCGSGGKALPLLPTSGVPLSVRDPRDEAPWLDVDFKVNPLLYCAVVKNYCWEGNVNNDFVVQKNTVHVLRRLASIILTISRTRFMIGSQLVSCTMVALFR
jgi:hypothetical protein